jgi:hypothetical protein
MGIRGQAVGLVSKLPPEIHEAVPAELRTMLRHRLRHYYPFEVDFDHRRTPVLEPGEVTGEPDFVGIGVQKAGTSWWFQLIIQHPDVSHRASIHKERHFFGRFGAEAFEQADVDAYARWFPHRAGTKTGEWTPDYFYQAWVPPLLARAAPQAKFLLILRDPVQRFRSGLASQVRNGATHVGSTQAAALDYSLYAEAYRRWTACMPADQIMVMQYEACVANPAAELKRTYEFLGLDASFVPPDLLREVNKTVEAKAALPEDALSRLESVVGPDIGELAVLLPFLDLTLWPSAARLLG